MQISKDERVALFIDGPNLYATVKALGFGVDFSKLLAVFRERCRLLRALYFTTVQEGDEVASVRPLVDWLEYNGYTLVTKPVPEYGDREDGRRHRGNMHVELAVYAMQLAESVDHLVFVTGDGDFRSLVASLRRQGKRVTVISTLETDPPMISDELRRQADQFIDLVDIERLISRVAPPARNDREQSRGAPARYERGDDRGERQDERRAPVPVEMRSRRRSTPGNQD